MENEKTVEFNTGKGILFALAGMIIGFAIWLAVIALFGIGTGGAIGGVFAAVLGMLVAGGYRKGSGKPGAVGIIIVVLLTFVAAAAAITLGVAFQIYREGMGDSVFEALEILFDLLGTNRQLTTAFLQDFIISTGASVVMAIVSLVGTGKKKVKD